jgi:hypothetical protein
MPKTRQPIKYRFPEAEQTDQIRIEFERIKAALTPLGYKLRRSMNDANAWRCTSKGSTAFYLLCRPVGDSWKVLPPGTEPERETLVRLISEALQ